MSRRQIVKLIFRLIRFLLDLADLIRNWPF